MPDRKIAVQLGILERGLEAANGAVDVLWLGEDLGTQRGPIISRELFRKHIRPRLQRFVDLGRAWNIPVMMHSCGSSSWAFDDFIEMGIRVVDTLQPEARDMEPARLKARYGDRLAFHGMISTAGPVACGTVADVQRTCRETLEIMMPGGGYASAPTHCLQENSPTENVVARYETARQFGRYRRPPDPGGAASGCAKELCRGRKKAGATFSIGKSRQNMFFLAASFHHRRQGEREAR